MQQRVSKTEQESNKKVWNRMWERAKANLYIYLCIVRHETCLGIIYSRSAVAKISELRHYSIDELDDIPSALDQFIFFAEEKMENSQR